MEYVESYLPNRILVVSNGKDETAIYTTLDTKDIFTNIYSIIDKNLLCNITFDNGNRYLKKGLYNEVAIVANNKQSTVKLVIEITRNEESNRVIRITTNTTLNINKVCKSTNIDIPIPLREKDTIALLDSIKVYTYFFIEILFLGKSNKYTQDSAIEAIHKVLLQSF